MPSAGQPNAAASNESPPTTKPPITADTDAEMKDGKVEPDDEDNRSVVFDVGP